jgi:hypothetical protein
MLWCNVVSEEKGILRSPFAKKGKKGKSLVQFTFFTPRGEGRVR